MSWSYNAADAVWHCTSYNDLHYAEINNFAQYGQPFSPYESGYDHDHVPDFGNIVIRMPQSAVMTDGYGRNITADDFPIVNAFLDHGVPDPGFGVGLSEAMPDVLVASRALPVGVHRLGTLINAGTVANGHRFIQTNLYGTGKYGIDGGTIGFGDAAYIHGTVQLALMRDTRFIVTRTERRVEALIGAGDDDWDFNSSTIPPLINGTVAVLLGPDHYNLTAPIEIQYRGVGKRSVVRRSL